MCQFNIGGMDLSNKSKQKPNIFNKKTRDSLEIYNDIINDIKITYEDIEMVKNVLSTVNVNNKEELKKIVKFYSDNCPNDTLNWLDVSGITDMSYLFYGSKYNGDISKWNVSNVTNMAGMFAYSKFNKCISEWEVSNVENMAGMFAYSKFNWNISNWDVSNVTNMAGMFAGSQFNLDISKWDVTKVKYMAGMFAESQFDQDISKWNVSNETKEQMWGKI